MNKLIDLKNELKSIVDKNTFEYNGYKITPIVSQNYDNSSPTSPTRNGLVKSNNPVTYSMITQISYQLTGPDHNYLIINDEQLEVLIKFIQDVNYKDDFEKVLNEKID